MRSVRSTRFFRSRPVHLTMLAAAMLVVASCSSAAESPAASSGSTADATTAADSSSAADTASSAGESSAAESSADESGAGSATGSSSAGSGSAEPIDFGAEAPTLRLGYFGNLTHAAAVLGVSNGTFQEALGDTTLETSVFNAGPAAIEALTGGAIDATFIGPNPAINSYAKSNGDSIRIVAGATNNGAALVVRDTINGPEDLRDKTLATPQLGGTQDVALRKWLLDNGLKVDTTGGSDVAIASQENSQTLDLFKSGEVDGGWLPEPWASRLIVEAGAKVLVDEKDLWEGGEFPTTILIVSRTYLEQYPGTVAKLLQGHLAELAAIEADPSGSKTALNAALAEISGKPLGDGVIDRAFGEIIPTYDPVASVTTELSEHGLEAGTLKELPNLDNIYDLRILNQLLVADGKEPVSAGGLGQE